jgi:hypothetical protein
MHLQRWCRLQKQAQADTLSGRHTVRLRPTHRRRPTGAGRHMHLHRTSAVKCQAQADTLSPSLRPTHTLSLPSSGPGRRRTGSAVMLRMFPVAAFSLCPYLSIYQSISLFLSANLSHTHIHTYRQRGDVEDVSRRRRLAFSAAAAARLLLAPRTALQRRAGSGRDVTLAQILT